MDLRPGTVVAVTLKVTATVPGPVDGLLQVEGTVKPEAPQLAGFFPALLALAVKSAA
jgi:hypothetical protein